MITLKFVNLFLWLEKPLKRNVKKYSSILEAGSVRIRQQILTVKSNLWEEKILLYMCKRYR